jgi:hypothetical protein
MTPKKIREEIREKTYELESWIKMSESSDEVRKTYSGLIETYQKQIQELKDQLTSQGKKSKGNIDKSIFEGKPFLTVSIDKSITKRNYYDSIRMYWSQLKDKKCDYLVEEKGYVVGVINKVVLGVVQVDRWERIKEGEHEGRVKFFGKLLSDHPSIEYSLKERTVSGPIQGFNFPDQDEKDS